MDIFPYVAKVKKAAKSCGQWSLIRDLRNTPCLSDLNIKDK